MGKSDSSSAKCVFAVLVVFMLAGLGISDIDQDRAECADQLIGLASCLPYVGGDKNAKTPTIDCCTGLEQVDKKSHKCLCILIKDHDDPKLGLDVNVTLALKLPTACHVPVDIPSCVDILHLDPKSKTGKLFLDYANMTKTMSTNTSAPTSSANSTSSGTVANDQSDGWSLGNGLLGIEMVFVTLMCFYISHLVVYV